MPHKSRRQRARHPARDQKRQPTPDTRPVAATRPAAPETPARPPVAPKAAQTKVQYPHVASELKRIGILAGILVIILIILALVLP